MARISKEVNYAAEAGEVGVRIQTFESDSAAMSAVAQVELGGEMLEFSAKEFRDLLDCLNDLMLGAAGEKIREAACE